MRLEGQAEGGYFPTPPRVVQMLDEWLYINRYGSGNVRILDPCAGKGVAVAALGALLRRHNENVKVETYGIEENDNRSKAAAGKVDRFLSADFFTTTATEGEFSVLLLNPPYDHSVDKRRMEFKFLRESTKLLSRNGGILVFLIPENTIPLHLSYLTANYEQLVFRRFPQPEYDRFKQVVILGTRKWREEPDEYLSDNILRALKTETIPPLDREDNSNRHYQALPSHTPSALVEFSAERFDPKMALTAMAKNDPFELKEITDLILPPAIDTRTRPLTPLRKGHTALLLAAGLINNLVLEKGDDRIIIKGQAHKQTAVTERTRAKYVETEQLHITVRALDLKTGLFSTIRT